MEIEENVTFENDVVKIVVEVEEEEEENLCNSRVIVKPFWQTTISISIIGKHSKD